MCRGDDSLVQLVQALFVKRVREVPEDDSANCNSRREKESYKDLTDDLGLAFNEKSMLQLSALPLDPRYLHQPGCFLHVQYNLVLPKSRPWL